ncbi:flagellar biosynthesis protein FlgJ [bacterium BFN5]|nr:flagellar biosynthesis protein FlgJ [bacterium BFN5]QJW46008.1 flagellar biosynthesis protein FlgJ [bacterium BFN5]
MQINSVGSQILTNKLSSAQNKADSDFAAKLKTAAAATDSKEEAKLKKVCKDMEAVFLNLLLSKMRDTVPESSLTGNSSHEKTMRSLLDSEMTKNMAQAGGIGLADMIYRQLSVTAGSANKSQAR